MGLKLKIFIGYVILILLLGFIIYLFRGEYTKRNVLNREMEELETMRDLTRTAYSSLLELASQGEIVSIWNESDLEQYRRKREGACQVLDELKSFVPMPEQQVRIDSVCLLLQQKETLLSAATNTFNEMKTIAGTVDEKLPAIVHQVRKQKVTDISAIPANDDRTAEEKPEKVRKSFLKNIFGGKEKKSAYRKQQEEKGRLETERKNRISVSPNSGSNAAVYLLHSLNREVTEKQKAQQQKLSQQMDSLYLSSRMLNGRLSVLVSDFDKVAGERLAARYKAIVADSEKSYNTAARLSLFVLLLAIVLYTVVHRDVNRSLKYRRELEYLNRKNRELLNARDRMMLTVSHDLRAPLTSIRGYADAMPDEVDREKRFHYRDAILQSSDTMLALLNSLLVFYRLDMGKEQAEEVLFRLRGVSDALETAYRLQAEKKGLRFTAYCDRDAVLWGDRERILQVGNNLLSNAVKFTSSGGVNLRVRYERGMLRMEVEDTGTGISQERIEGVFQPFERLGNVDMPEGFGLGLAITQRIVRLLQGEISLDSVVGRGTVFKVMLPLPLADENPVRKNPTGAVSLPENLYVAVVDNDAVLLEMTTGMFTRHKIRCDGYHNAGKLLEGMRERAYDIVITDIRMPGINGFELLELLRSSKVKALNTVPVVAVTACPEKSWNEFLEAGFSGYLHKPFSVSELFSVVKSCLCEGRKHPLPKADFSPLLVAERNRAEMLELFIRETRKDMAALEKYADSGDKDQLITLVHHLSPIWENIRIGTPLRELRKLLDVQEDITEGTVRTAVENVVTTGARAVRQAEEMVRTESDG